MGGGDDKGLNWKKDSLTGDIELILECPGFEALVDNQT